MAKALHKKTVWTKWCRRCGKKYVTMGRTSKYCTDCYLTKSPLKHKKNFKVK